MAMGIYIGRDKKLEPSMYSTQCSSPGYQATSPYRFVIYILATYSWDNGCLFCFQIRIKGHVPALPPIMALPLHFSLTVFSVLLIQTLILPFLWDLPPKHRGMASSKFTQCTCTTQKPLQLRRTVKFILGFPGGPVVKTLPSNAVGMGFIPGQGTKIPHAM